MRYLCQYYHSSHINARMGGSRAFTAALQRLSEYTKSAFFQIHFVVYWGGFFT